MSSQEKTGSTSKTILFRCEMSGDLCAVCVIFSYQKSILCSPEPIIHSKKRLSISVNFRNGFGTARRVHGLVFPAYFGPSLQTYIDTHTAHKQHVRTHNHTRQTNSFRLRICHSIRHCHRKSAKHRPNQSKFYRKIPLFKRAIFMRRQIQWKCNMLFGF